MNVRLFAKMNHYAFGLFIGLLIKNVQEEKMVAKQQQSIRQLVILIGQLVTFSQNAIINHLLLNIQVNTVLIALYY